MLGSAGVGLVMLPHLGKMRQPPSPREDPASKPENRPAGSRPPFRWSVAGNFLRLAPQWRGRDRVFGLLAGDLTSQRLAVYSGQFGPGIKFTVDWSEDSAARELFFVQYQDPALVPILSAALGPGSCFYDVGAYIGLYTLWASKLVGHSGQVHAFEPVPSTRAMLADLVKQNRAQNVSVAGTAVGDHGGSVVIRVPVGASGLASALQRSWDVPVKTVESPLTTLDDYARAHRPPDLVKIDVEGFEFAVLQGMVDLLRDGRPMIVLEVLEAHLAAAQTSLRAIRQYLAGFGYSVWNLTRRGARQFGERQRLRNGDWHSQNVLAARAGAHDQSLAQLRRASFGPNQTH